MTDIATRPAAAAAGIRWDLSDLYSGQDDPSWGADLERILGDAVAFATRYRGTINVAGGPTAEHLRAALAEYEEIQERASRAGAYARLLYAADTASAEVRELVNRADNFSTQLRNHLLFFDLEWLELSDA